MKNYLARTGTRFIAIIEVMFSRTFELRSSCSKGGDFNYVEHYTDIREEDYK